MLPLLLLLGSGDVGNGGPVVSGDWEGGCSCIFLFNFSNSVLISGFSLGLFLPVSGLGVVDGGLLALGVLCSGA